MYMWIHEYPMKIIVRESNLSKDTRILCGPIIVFTPCGYREEYLGCEIFFGPNIGCIVHVVLKMTFLPVFPQC